METIDAPAGEQVRIGQYEVRVDFCEPTPESRARFERRAETLALPADTVQFYNDGPDFPTTPLLLDEICGRDVRQRRSRAKTGVSELRERHPRSGVSFDRVL